MGWGKLKKAVKKAVKSSTENIAKGGVIHDLTKTGDHKKGFKDSLKRSVGGHAVYNDYQILKEYKKKDDKNSSSSSSSSNVGVNKPYVVKKPTDITRSNATGSTTRGVAKPTNKKPARAAVKSTKAKTASKGSSSSVSSRIIRNGRSR